MNFRRKTRLLNQSGAREHRKAKLKELERIAKKAKKESEKADKLQEAKNNAFRGH